jgi:hypothetical protein
LPLGLATAAIAGLLVWLGSGLDDEPTTMAEPAAELAPAAPETPGTPELRPVLPEPAATVTASPEPALSAPSLTAEAALSAEPADTAPAAEASAATAEPSAAPAAEASAAPAATGAEPAADAPGQAEASTDEVPKTATPSTSEPVPSDEGLTAGPITTVYMAPDCAVLYRRGKRVGRSGVRVMTPEGKRRAFEVVCPGHGTRKLTLDGTHKEVMVGLRPN